MPASHSRLSFLRSDLLCYIYDVMHPATNLLPQTVAYPIEFLHNVVYFYALIVCFGCASPYLPLLGDAYVLIY